MSERYFPEWLKARKIWVLWRLEKRDGRTTKVPYSARFSGHASSTDPNTWSSFEEAERRLSSGNFNGLGVVIAPDSGLVFVDIDGCFHDGFTDEEGYPHIGSVDERGADVSGAFADTPTYMELSQSGTGLHILALGSIPKSFHNRTADVEMYDSGRFVALTGSTFEPFNVDVAPAQPALDYVFRKYRTPEQEKRTHSPETKRESVACAKDDKWVIERASSHGGKFADLFAGHYEKAGYSSQSEADEALCVLLCFWTDGDPARMDRLFRSSGLYRAKWERDDYRNRTMQNAIDHCGETLSECIQRKRREEVKKFEEVYLAEW